MSYPRIFADFHNADTAGQLRLKCIGTIEDLARQQIELQVGQLLTLYSEELEVDGDQFNTQSQRRCGWRGLIGIKSVWLKVVMSVK